MILDIKINFPSYVFGHEFNNVSIEIEEPYDPWHGFVVVTLWLNGDILGMPNFAVPQDIDVYVDNPEHDLIFSESKFINELKEYFNIKELV